ncbi:MAG: HEPN domain-containing protein [Desulfobacca sp.]|nr:HEPN domain-containing protein [Desulfobacca sp.]
MNQVAHKEEIINYWLVKAEESLAAAQDDLKANRLSLSVNRIYYACFYVVNTFLLKQNFQFRKHSGVRAAFHKHLVKPGIVSHEYGKLYDELFEARQRADYIEFVSFERDQVTDWLTRSQNFVEIIKSLVKSPNWSVNPG